MNQGVMEGGCTRSAPGLVTYLMASAIHEPITTPTTPANGMTSSDADGMSAGSIAIATITPLRGQEVFPSFSRGPWRGQWWRGL